MSMKFKQGTMSADEIQVDYSMNDRLSATENVIPGLDLKVDTYSIGELLDQVVEAGAIHTPLVIDGKTKQVLQGFRRATVAKRILSNDAYPAELRNAMKRLPVNIYTDLTDTERSSLIHDKGVSKGVGRAELIRSAWRMKSQGFSEKEISNHLRHEIARYTGNSNKLNSLPDDVVAREKQVQKWFHGTVGQYFIASYLLGPRVQNAVMLTALSEDNLIPKDENGVPTMRPEFVAKRGRILELTAASKQDREQKAWNDAKFTGPAFEAKIAEFITEDTTGVSAPKVSAMSKAKLDEFVNTSCKSAVSRAAANVVYGPVPEFPDLDQAAARWEAVDVLLRRYVENIANDEIRDVVARILHTENLVELDNFLAGLQNVSARS